ncbi:MAG: hypothetical protein U0324_01355 [Polyangiales bacterium]
MRHRTICILAGALAASCGSATVQGLATDSGVLDESPTDAGPARDAPPADTPPTVVAHADASDGGAHVVDLAVGDSSHQCALMSDGTVRCRGSDYAAAFGIGIAGHPLEAVEVPGLSGVVQVVTTRGVTCTRGRDGSVRCWGTNEYGQLGTGHEGDEMCSWAPTPTPCRTRPTRVPGLDDVVGLAAAEFAVCAIRRDGSVWCWGSATPYLPHGGSPVPVRAMEVADVTALWWRRLGWIARHRDGRYTTVPISPELTIPTDAEMGDGYPSDHTCYRLPDTTVRCMGVNANGKVGNGRSAGPGGVAAPVDPGLTGVRSIAMGAYHTCAVLDDRTVRCWGDGSYGGLGFDAREQCAGLNRPTMCATTPTRVPGVEQVERVFPGVWGTCVLRVDHEVWCWGTLAGLIQNATSTPRRAVW